MAVSTLLPNLRATNVGRVMQYLEWNVGNGFVDVPPTLTWPMLKQMRRDGFTIGSHTTSHVSLPMESDGDRRRGADRVETGARGAPRRVDRSLRVSGRTVYAAVVEALERDRLSVCAIPPARTATHGIPR